MVRAIIAGLRWVTLGAVALILTVLVCVLVVARLVFDSILMLAGGLVVSIVFGRSNDKARKRP